MKSFRQSWTLLLTTLPGVALAEVSDKIASVPSLWTTALAAGGLALLVGRFKLLLGVALLPISLFLVAASLEPLLDPYVGPTVLREQGERYAASVYGSCAAILSLHLFGLWLGLRRRRAAA